MEKLPSIPADSSEFPEEFRAGYIALIGKPNVGKSTLLNRLIGQKISITSSKPQTTRQRILGIATSSSAQYIFVDTPGFQTKHHSTLNRLMNKVVSSTLREVSVVVWVIEALHFNAADKALLKLLPAELPVILAINKIDTVSQKEELLPFIAKMAELRNFAAVVPISATRNQQLQQLQAEIEKYLPISPPLYDPEQLTDRSERFLAAEIIREKIFRLLGEEVPYATSVSIEKFEETPGLRRIYANILVDKDNQKPILLGKDGQKMRQIASEARLDMEKLFDCKVFLEVWIKVRQGWADDMRILRELGYQG